MTRMSPLTSAASACSRVHRAPIRGALADEVVQLVDEQDEITVGCSACYETTMRLRTAAGTRCPELDVIEAEKYGRR